MSDTDLPLEDQVALVTGGSRGIGRAIAEELARRGAHVCVNYRASEDRAAEVVTGIREAGGRAIAERADVGDADQARAVVHRVSERIGPVDVLVNNAGVQSSARVHEMGDEDWHRVMDVNLHAPFYLCRAALPGMLERSRGCIVNVASASSVVAQPGASSYVASKHAIIGFTKAVAAETAGRGVRVNAVAPGLTDTDLVAGLTEKQAARLHKMVPMGRIADPREVARVVAFAVCDASYCTGNTFHVSGGVVMD